MNERGFCDSNVLLYLFDQNPVKKAVATQVLNEDIWVSSQVLAEVANVLKRQFKLDKASVVVAIEDIMAFCHCAPVAESTLRRAFTLINRYDFQFFDAIVVAGALEVNCVILYSEDMQHELLVEKQLRILNPFLS